MLGAGPLTESVTAAAAAIVLAAAVAGCGSADERRAEQALMLRDTCVSMIERAFPGNWPLIVSAAAADPADYRVGAPGSSDLRPVDLLLMRCLP